MSPGDNSCLNPSSMRALANAQQILVCLNSKSRFGVSVLDLKLCTCLLSIEARLLPLLPIQYLAFTISLSNSANQRNPLGPCIELYILRHGLGTHDRCETLSLTRTKRSQPQNAAESSSHGWGPRGHVEAFSTAMRLMVGHVQCTTRNKRFGAIYYRFHELEKFNLQATTRTSARAHMCGHVSFGVLIAFLLTLWMPARALPRFPDVKVRSLSRL